MKPPSIRTTAESKKRKPKIGEHYEAVACQYLIERGVTLLSKNFVCKAGEIDLIMKDKNDLIFVEVRYRTASSFGCALDSITPHKTKRIIKAAKTFLQTNTHLMQNGLRFDVVTIDKRKFSPAKINWIPDAFSAETW